jgi:hypothetical protein
VALSVLGGNAGSLVGVAISASLLPPAVNAGLFWALALVLAAGGTASSVGDPEPDPDPHVFEPSGFGSICQRYGSGPDPSLFL